MRRAADGDFGQAAPRRSALPRRSGLAVREGLATRSIRAAALVASALVGIALAAKPASTTAQLRVATYNAAIAQAGGTQTARPSLATVLAAIGAETVGGIAKPIDLLLLQEQFTMATSAQSIVDMLNGLYGPGVYARSRVDGAVSALDGEGGRPGLVYNTRTVQLVEELAFGTASGAAQARQTLRYRLRPAGYDSTADFYVFNSHYKASTGAENEARRLLEAQAVRTSADALGDGVPILYGGDFNIVSSAESMYQQLLASGPGQAFDPVQAPGTWRNNAALRRWHTQSPAAAPRYSGQVTGGVDDRFDFLLMSGELLDGEGLSYVTGSYRTFGNNGTHACCNAAIASGTGASAAVLLALEQASDHLPVVADLQLPAWLSASASLAAGSVTLGSAALVRLEVANAAPALVPAGADELDYVFTVSGALHGGGSGSDAALGSGNRHELLLDTSTLGRQTGWITVTATSQATARGQLSIPVEFFVTPAAPSAEPADFNRDGVVDDVDLAVWSTAWGVTGGADADEDGVSGGSDLLAWQQRYGWQDPATAGGIVAIPEPRGWLLAASGSLAAAATRPQRAVRSVARTGGGRRRPPHRGGARRFSRRLAAGIRSLSTSSPGGTVRCGA